jgi:predicted aconitase/predicted aconitase with swiveling domain
VSREDQVALSQFDGQTLIGGETEGKLLYSDVPLSFWGGIDPTTGEVIDRHHPLSGANVSGMILALPSGRGSCTGSSVMLQLILNGRAPAALLLGEPDEILTLGVLIAGTLFERSLPVVCVAAHFGDLARATVARVQGAHVTLFSSVPKERWTSSQGIVIPVRCESQLKLTAFDRDMLDGVHGEAAAVAMRIVIEIGELQGARELLDVTRAHIDGCIYTGPASLSFAQRLVELGARVRVPTTLNAISVDRRQWRSLGIPPAFGEPADALAQAYLDMGAEATFTCAPYLLDATPELGEQIVWAESNAVVFANSVLGARTQKYPDYLDICIALTGRAPLVGCHHKEGRAATLQIDVDAPDGFDDAFYPLLGYNIGLLCGSQIPVITGLEAHSPDIDELKAFGAAFATTSASPMFHIVGRTPEAPTVEAALHFKPPRWQLSVGKADLARAWRELDSARSSDIQLVALGNPHLSLEECAKLAALCSGRQKSAGTDLVITVGRSVHRRADAAGYLERLQAFGAKVITDTCWCMLEEPVVPPQARTLMTNSGKYAHYAPGLVGREVQFGSMESCVEAACSGTRSPALPDWLNESP